MTTPGPAAAPSVTEHSRPIPLILPAQATVPQYRGDAFRPVIVADPPACITGDPTCLHVISDYSRSGLTLTIPAQVWIEGFAVNAGLLYVQDGPVLQSWSLTDPMKLQFAQNLVTGTTWDGTGTMPQDFTVGSGQSLLDALQAARQNDVWATFVEDAEAVLLTTIAAVRLAPLAEFAAAVAAYEAAEQALQQMRAMLGAKDTSQAAPALTASLHADRVTAEQNATAIRFSAPVVRGDPFGDAPIGQVVFTLSGAGGLYYFDYGLADSPQPMQGVNAAVSQLALVETTSGCLIFYPAAAGGIQRVDASVSPPAPIAAIVGTPPIAPEEILPLATAGDYVWGGGLPGVAFFGDPISSLAASPGFVVASGAFTGYDVDPVSKLVLAFDAAVTRLTSYDPAAKEPNRWPGATEPVAGWTFFWPDVSTVPAPVPTMPRLVLRMDRVVPAGQTGIGYRVYVANTVDDAMNLGTFTPPVTLVAGTLNPGPFSGVTTSIARLRAQPTVSDDIAYAVVRRLSPTDEVAALIVPSADTSQLTTPWATFFGANQAAFATTTGAWALGQCPLPTLGSSLGGHHTPPLDALAAFDISSVRNAVATAAPAELARIQQVVAAAQAQQAVLAAQALAAKEYAAEVQVQILSSGSFSGDYPIPNQSFEFRTNPQPVNLSELVTITTDENGNGRLNPGYAGSQLLRVGFPLESVGEWSAALQATGVNKVYIQRDVF